MSEFLKSLKYIVLSFVSLGVVFITMSISGFCDTITINRNTTDLPSDNSSYTCFVDFPSSFTFDIKISGVSGGDTIFFTSAIHVVTSYGDYVVRSAQSNFTVSSGTNTYSKDLGLTGIQDYYLPGYYIMCYLEYSYNSYGGAIGPLTQSPSGSFSGAYSDTTVNTLSRSSGTVSFSNTLSSFGSDYSVILNQIYQELLDQGLTLDDIYTELLDQGLSIDSLVNDISLLKKSICYDFPNSIDGNYCLSDVFFSPFYSSYLNNSVFSIGPCSFDFNTPLSNFYFYFSCPSSHKVRIYSTLSNINSLISAFTYDGVGYSVFGSVFSSSLGSCFEFSIPESIPTGGFILIRFSTISGRFALYDYVLSANDILDYMESQWGQVTPNVGPTNQIIGDSDDLINDWSTYETSAFTDLDTAYANSGISGFAWSGFTGIQAFTSIVDQFYNVLPSEFKLYIIAGLIIGITSVVLSAVGRVVNTADQIEKDKENYFFRKFFK